MTGHVITAGTFRLENSYPNAVKFSPFTSSQLACTSSENFGLFGKGFGHVFQINSSGIITLSTQFVWRDSLLDLSWSEVQPDLVVTAAGDGTLQLWNIHQPHSAMYIYVGHQKEVYSVQWNQTKTGDNFISSSWDQTVKLWDVQCNNFVHSFDDHQHFVYDAVWSPHLRDLFASVSGDGCLRLWNILNKQPALLIRAHDAEVLSCDWNKYNQHLIATASSDGLIRCWDIRVTTAPVIELQGHRYAVRRVLFSPYKENVLVSASYDFSTRIWTMANDNSVECDISNHHSEFVYGLDLSLHIPDLIADCSWDKLIRLFTPVMKQ